MRNGPAHSSNGSFKKESNAEVMQLAFMHVRTMMNGPAHSSNGSFKKESNAEVMQVAFKHVP
jgi:predicted small metal-binding protein